MTEKMIPTVSHEMTAALFGAFDANVAMIERAFGVRIDNSSGGSEAGDAIFVRGEEKAVALAARCLDYLSHTVGEGDVIDAQTVEYVIGLVRDGVDGGEQLLSTDTVTVTNQGKPVKPKTVGQMQYVESIRKNILTLGIGPAGTGKTFLAVAMAVEALRSGSVSRIVLTRPAVEAGERLGFLPGDLQSKVDPYLRPLYDGLYEIMGAENFQKHLERGTVEIAPLAYMRGRTLNDSFIILDEAQNTTHEQMKMFLTRLGMRSKAVVTGDLSQTDLPNGQVSGLSIAERVLTDIDGIGIFRFTERDVVRHSLVRKIISAYDSYEKSKSFGKGAKS